MTKVLLTLNHPNGNGRTYRSHDISQALANYREKMPNKPFLIGKHHLMILDSITFDNNIGQVDDISIDGDDLIGNIQIYPTFEYYKSAIEEGEMHIRPAGMGNVDEHGIVHDYVLTSFFITSDPA